MQIAVKIRTFIDWVLENCLSLLVIGASGKGSLMGGRPRVKLRLVLTGILHIVRTGSQWRMLPATMGPFQTVYHYFNRWSKQGVFWRIYRSLLKLAQPDLRAAIIDATHSMAPLAPLEISAFGPKFSGKRAVKISQIVNKAGILLGMVIAPANIHDSKLVGLTIESAKQNLGEDREEFLNVIYADAAYVGEVPKEIAKLLDVALHALERPSQKRRPVAAKMKARKTKRYVIEHSFSWKNQFRRLKVVYEKLESTILAMHYLGAAIVLIGKIF